MSPQTHTVQTQYGEATIETYDCDSCGNTVAYENTVPFKIGDREGRACGHCEDEGPISFPERVRNWCLPKDDDSNNQWNLLQYLFTAPIMSGPVFLDAFTAGDDDFASGYTVGFTTALIWLVLPLLVFIVVM